MPTIGSDINTFLGKGRQFSRLAFYYLWAKYGYMLFFRFLFSKFFLKQLGLALLAGIVIIIACLEFLKDITHHGQTQEVPNLQHLPLVVVDTLLRGQELRYEVLDSAKYDPELPSFAVTEQNPAAGERVKRNRKIYLTLNPSDYRKVSIPNVIQITRRNAASTLKSVGLEVGKITYRNNIGKNMVLEMRYQGKKIAPGTLLPKTTPIDLVLGNGKR